MRRDGGAAMTSTHDDYAAAARRYAAGLLRDEAEVTISPARMNHLLVAAEWLEAGA